MDDTSDTCKVEQSAVSVRLVYNGEVEEHMLGMIDASDDQSADALTEIMLSTLEKYKIKSATSGNKLIGQSYDGAPTMSGELNGVQKQIQQHYPAAYYNNCVAHRVSRWLSRDTAKSVIDNHYETIRTVLYEISRDRDDITERYLSNAHES
eukprot:Seg3879.5 transcript_id=Seg3879.5/GoldUCD/mRNA.D3Y31 product="hypothetical protein" protein_id=Seg3879.5/GoldUCD/D3Y31